MQDVLGCQTERNMERFMKEVAFKTSFEKEEHASGFGETIQAERQGGRMSRGIETYLQRRLSVACRAFEWQAKQPLCL